MTKLWIQKKIDCQYHQKDSLEHFEFIVITKGMYIYTLKVTRHLGHLFLSYYRFQIGVWEDGFRFRFFNSWEYMHEKNNTLHYMSNGRGGLVG